MACDVPALPRSAWRRQARSAFPAFPQAATRAAPRCRSVLIVPSPEAREVSARLERATFTLRDMAATHTNLRVWIDIDNPPQVQYLLPFVEAFRRRDVAVALTARDYGNAFELLRLRDASFHAVGREFGGSKVAKARGALGRARHSGIFSGLSLRRMSFSPLRRSSALAARLMGIPTFVIGDYEYANSSFYRLTGSTIFYPNVIDPVPFLRSGVRPDRLIPFSGLKEDARRRGPRRGDLSAFPGDRR